MQGRAGVGLQVAQCVPLYERDVERAQRLAGCAVLLDLKALYRVAHLRDRHCHIQSLAQQGTLPI